MRSARSAVMLGGFTVNSIRPAKSAANSPEKLMSTISTEGRPRRLPISSTRSTPKPSGPEAPRTIQGATPKSDRSEEHTSELQSLMRISYAVFCLKKQKNTTRLPYHKYQQLNHKPYLQRTRYKLTML